MCKKIHVLYMKIFRKTRSEAKLKTKIDFLNFKFSSTLLP